MGLRRFSLLFACLALAGCGGGGSSSTSSSTTATTTSTTTAATTTTPSTAAGAPDATSSISDLIPPTPAELAQGRRLFQASAAPAGCGLCRSFRPAATTGTSGPNLDDELTEADLRAYTDAQLAQQVRNWINDGRCLAPTDPTRCMPPGIYAGQDANLVAVFVATCGRDAKTAGCAPVAGPLRGAALAGERLYQTRGCSGCHFTAGTAQPIGPSLNGLAGSKVTLADGTTVTANDGYLTAAIADPDAQIVKGFQAGMMSARVAPQHLTPAQIRALVAYIETLKG
jgi:cytochrome c551/c552